MSYLLTVLADRAAAADKRVVCAIRIPLASAARASALAIWLQHIGTTRLYVLAGRRRNRCPCIGYVLVKRLGMQRNAHRRRLH